MPGFPRTGSPGKYVPNPRARTIVSKKKVVVPKKKKLGVKINPKNPQLKIPMTPPKPKVVVSPLRPGVTPSSRPGGGGGGTGGRGARVVKSGPTSGAGTRPGASKTQTGKVGTTTPKVPKLPGIGFDPQKLATTLTNLSYDAEIAEINRQIALNSGNMTEALKDIQGWAAQVEDQRATGAAAGAQAFQDARAHAEVSDNNIAQLFGGQAGGENAAYSNVNEDMIGAIGASDQAFDARMAPILQATFADMSRRAQGSFGQQKNELLGTLRDTTKEKGQARQETLMKLMDMAWQRKQDQLQFQTAQQALQQARALSGLEIQQAQQGIQQGQQQIESNTLSNKAAKIALKSSQVELQKLQASLGGSGLDWADPGTGPAVAKGALTGALGPAGAFIVNPKIAWENAKNALAIVGAQNDPRALKAVWNAFVVSLRLSHQKKRWGEYRLNKKGELIYDPTKKFKKK